MNSSRICISAIGKLQQIIFRLLITSIWALTFQITFTRSNLHNCERIILDYVHLVFWIFLNIFISQIMIAIIRFYIYLTNGIEYGTTAIFVNILTLIEIILTLLCFILMASSFHQNNACSELKPLMLSYLIITSVQIVITLLIILIVTYRTFLLSNSLLYGSQLIQ